MAVIYYAYDQTIVETYVVHIMKIKYFLVFFGVILLLGKNDYLDYAMIRKNFSHLYGSVFYS
jgi:hypothetical protein